MESCCRGCSQSVVDHQFGKHPSINQNDLGVNCLNIILRVVGKLARSYEDTFFCSLAMKGSDKLLDVRSSNRPLPAFRLKINQVKSEPIFFDNAVYSFIEGDSRRNAPKIL